jgi:hypothetical protein
MAPVILAAAIAASPSPHLRAVKVEDPPVLDGKLDDPAWAKAVATDRFTQKQPHDGSAATYRTVMRVVYDDDAIYVSFDCWQTTPVIDRLTRRDRLIEADWVTVDLGSRFDHKSSFEFGVYASGQLADAIRFNDTDWSLDWDENWEAKTAKTDHGWSAEMRIPMRILRFETRAVQSWDIEARRWVSDLQEEDDWAYWPRTMGGEVSHYGVLDDLRGLEERTAFELRPFVVGRVRRRDSSPLQLASGVDFAGSAGIDFKWHPTQDLTLDGTLNPDFAQVEADQVVLNLTTFETYYPEKRPFFLEGMDTFSTPFQLLYTRRIGRVPAAPSTATGEQLVDVPEPATIYDATKITGRIGEKWTIGTLQATVAPNDVQVQLANGQRVSRLADPTSAFEVFRLRRDVGENANVGVMMTAATHAEPTSSYPVMASGQLCPSGDVRSPGARCFNDAYVGGLDWRWRSASGEWSTGGQVIASSLPRGPARPVADGTVIHNGDIGLGGQAYVSKDGGEHWVGHAGVTVMNRQLDFNDLGYNQRANQIGPGAGIEWRELTPFGPFLELHVMPNYGTTYNLDGLLVGQGLYLPSFGRFKNFWGYYTDVHYRGTKFDDREVGDGTALEREGRFGHEINVWSDSTKRVIFSVDQISDVIYDGANFQGNVDVLVRALPQLDFELMPQYQYTYGEPRFVGDGPNAGQYLFGRQEAANVGAVLRSTYTFFPRLTLQAFAQLFLASVHYTGFTQFQSDPNGKRPNIRVADLSPYGTPLTFNPDSEQPALDINLVLRWEFKLGSLLYLVYTRSQTPSLTLGGGENGRLDLGAIGRSPAADALLLKLSYWWGG